MRKQLILVFLSHVKCQCIIALQKNGKIITSNLFLPRHHELSWVGGMSMMETMFPTWSEQNNISNCFIRSTFTMNNYIHTSLLCDVQHKKVTTVSVLKITNCISSQIIQTARAKQTQITIAVNYEKSATYSEQHTHRQEWTQYLRQASVDLNQLIESCREKLSDTINISTTEDGDLA